MSMMTLFVLTDPQHRPVMLARERSLMLADEKSLLLVVCLPTTDDRRWTNNLNNIPGTIFGTFLLRRMLIDIRIIAENSHTYTTEWTIASIVLFVTECTDCFIRLPAAAVMYELPIVLLSRQPQFFVISCTWLA